MGRHAAPGPPDRPTPERPEPVAPAPETSAPPPTPSPAEPPASPAAPIGLLASLALGAVVGLTAGGVLWWAGQSLAVAGAVAGGALLVVVLAAWVARGVAARHPLQ